MLGPAMAVRMSITSQASQTMYLAFNRVPTTSDYDYYGSSVMYESSSF
jgi:hypothetical protein